MTSLRSLCLSNMAQALHAVRPESQSWLNPIAFQGLAEAVLDALLSTLTEHQDEWIDRAGGVHESDLDQRATKALLAVLRNPERSG